jgi:phosphatidylinositol alpha-1,6-mannosyltransferase
MHVLHNRRVLLLTEEYPPVIGGIQNYLSELMAQLSPENTFVIAQDVKGVVEWDREQKYKIVRVNMRGFSIPRWRSAYRALEQAVKEFQPEIIVCGKALFEGRAALRIWEKYKIPYVVMTYGMEINTWLKTEKTKRDLLNVCENSARVFVINEEIKTTLEKSLDDVIKVRPLRGRTLMRDNIGNKFVKMYPGVDGFYSFEDNPNKDYPQKSHKTIVSVCRLVHRKGIDVVINAVNEIKKTIPDIKYIIMGEGPEKTALEELVRNLSLQNNVEFLGKVTREKMREVFQSADLFVLTPRNEQGNMEGFGIVYLEAAIAGLCAVGSKSGGVLEAVLDEKTGLLAMENNTNDTAKKIIRILQDENLRKQLASQAQKRAVEEFSWSKRATLFRGVVESVVK